MVLIMIKNKDVEIKDKVLLSVSEASMLFNIGEKKLRNLISNYPQADWMFYIGQRMMIKRKKFEEFILNTESI